jgi:hypothetical protein
MLTLLAVAISFVVLGAVIGGPAVFDAISLMKQSNRKI